MVLFNSEAFHNISWFIFMMMSLFVLMFFYPRAEKYISGMSIKWFKSQIMIHYFFFMGTVIHELSHAIASTALMVRVRKIVLFRPQKDINGAYTLGYVSHDLCGPLRSVLIGIAPIFGCSLVTYLVFVWAADPVTITSTINIATILTGVTWMFSNPLEWKVWVFLYIAIACALAGEPSPADKKSIPLLVGIIIVLGVFAYLLREFINIENFSTLWTGFIGITVFLADFFEKFPSISLAFRNIPDFLQNIAIFMNGVFKGITVIMFFNIIILIILYSIGFYFIRVRWKLSLS